MNHEPKSTYKAGFTIVETLVAVAVLMIAISGPLVVANKSLNAALYAKDYAIASFLTQEGIELIRNWKDNGVNAFQFSNLRASGPGTCHTACQVDINTTALLACPPNDCTLYIVPNRNGYAYATGESGQEKTIFSRSYSVALVPGSSEEIKVMVKVSWKKGTVDNEVIISSQIVENGL